MKCPAAKCPPSQPAFCEVRSGLPFWAFCSDSLEEQKPTVSYSCKEFSMKLGWSSGSSGWLLGLFFFFLQSSPVYHGFWEFAPDRPDWLWNPWQRQKCSSYTHPNQQKPLSLCSQRASGHLDLCAFLGDANLPWSTSSPFPAEGFQVSKWG